MKPVWLDRALIIGPYLSLCTSEKEFRAVLDSLDVPLHNRPRWVSEGAHATTHKLESPEHLAAVVCVAAQDHWEGSELAALLAHEAVHVFQLHCEAIGEREPSIEFEAYSIQSICLMLFSEYAKRIKPIKKGSR